MNKDNKFMNILKEWIIPAAVFLVLYFVITNFLFFNSRIPSESMVPTLEVRDRLFTSRIFNKDELVRGDIVVFTQDGQGNKLYIKRIIGLPGDVVELKENGDILINGELLDEPYVKNQIDETVFKKGLYFNMKLGKYEVPKGHFFLLGDNRDNSRDARYWKNPYISKENIEGKPLYRVWPLSRVGNIEK